VVKKDLTQLEEISIRSLGVIDSSNIEFKGGLTVLTGETGAGKTMVLTALGLVLGEKSDSDLVRVGAERATVTGKFKVSKEIAELIAENGGALEDNSAVITRTVSAQGKSRVLIGGSLTSTNFVSELSERLVEVHQQSSSLRLTKPNTVRELVDSFGKISTQPYSDIFNEYKDLQSRIKDLRNQLTRKDQEIAELQEFSKVFSAVKPKIGELESIENNLSKLGAVEDINQALTSALNNLENEDLSALNLLQQSRKVLDQVKGKDAELDQLIDNFSEKLLDLQDLTSELTSYLSLLEADPKQFAFLQERKSSINSLLKKYGKGSDRELAFSQLIEDGDSAGQRLKDLSGGEDRISEMESEAKSLFNKMEAHAKELTKLRLKSATKLGELVTSEIRALSMPNAYLQINVISKDPSLDSSFQSYGLDDLEILFCSHQGGKPLPLNKVASGGELSRVMLALEVVIADTQEIGTYIFDEVDAGVGGKAAIEIGRRLSGLSKKAQVIVITHLPQVAVWADQHLVVKKNEGGSVTQSDVLEVLENERKVEIARMLSGQESSETAQQHAAELLQVVRESVIS
jgi:DNA repair protein RecN (Recombination protein N)